MAVKSNIRKLRKEKRLSQGRLAQEIGVSQQVISRMERDRERICIKHLIRLSEFFGVSTDYILSLTDQPEREEVPDFIQEKLKGMSGAEVFEIFQRAAKEVCRM